MKKLILTVALASSVAFVSAQDMMSKRGTPILPEAGDWSIGFDVIPLVKSFGNMFNNTGYTPNSLYQTPNTLVGKYMMDENTALRVKLRIGIGSEKTENLVDMDGSTATPTPTVADSWKASGNAITIGAGLQKFRGKGRLKGIYGAEAGIMFGSGKHTYEYGNAFSTTNTTPTSTTDWFTLTSGPVNSRVTEEKDGSTFGLYLRGFIGAEYFFAPKMSISAEYGWGLNMMSVGEGEMTSEYWNGTGVATSTSTVGKASNFAVDVDNANGQIVLALYF